MFIRRPCQSTWRMKFGLWLISGLRTLNCSDRLKDCIIFSCLGCGDAVGARLRQRDHDVRRRCYSRAAFFGDSCPEWSVGRDGIAYSAVETTAGTAYGKYFGGSARPTRNLAAVERVAVVKYRWLVVATKSVPHIGSHMLVSKTKQCMSKHALLHSEDANGLLGYLCTNTDRKSVAYRFFRLLRVLSKKCQKSLRFVRFSRVHLRFTFLFS